MHAIQYGRSFSFKVCFFHIDIIIIIIQVHFATIYRLKYEPSYSGGTIVHKSKKKSERRHLIELDEREKEKSRNVLLLLLFFFF